MARKAIKSIDWAALNELIPASEKASYAAFKAKSDQILQRMMANPESQPKLDWSYYKKTIATPNLVEKFQQQYESLSIPYPADKYTADIDAKCQETAKEVQKFIEEANKLIAEYKDEIHKINTMVPLKQMTREDYVTYFPDGIWSKTKVSLWPHTPDAQDNPEDEKMAEDDHH